MRSLNISNEEKRRLTNERQNAVRNAWKIERERVLNGKGTRNWSEEQQKEIIERGAVKGYEGHHMKSVSLFPDYAGNSQNIQFLTEKEHLYGAHQGSYHTLTNGYYDPENHMMVEFNDNELRAIPEVSLENSESEDLRNVLSEDYENDATAENSSFENSNEAQQESSNDYGVEQ